MSEPQLLIGNKNYSSWSLRPWFLLRGLDIPFVEVPVKLFTAEGAAEIARWSPAGKVPVMRHDGITVWDSLAIGEYVHEALAPGRGWPGDTAARAEARSISAEMHSGFHALRGEMPMNLRARRRIAPSTACERDVARVLAIWNGCRARHAAGGPWLFGRFSIADAMYAPVACRFETYGVPMDGAAAQWARTVREHPAMLEWAAASRIEPEVIAADEAGEPVA